MRIIGARATATALPFDRLIEALRARLAGGCEVPPRHVHQPDEGMTSLIMPAWVPGGAYAVKLVNIAPGNAARGLPGLHSTVLLHDGATGRWRRQGLDAQAVVLLERAAADADIVSCATFSTTPVIQGAWLRAGSHLDLIGSFTPAMREADDACFRGAGLYIDTTEALAKSGDLLSPMSRGVIGGDAGAAAHALIRAGATLDSCAAARPAPARGRHTRSGRFARTRLIRR